MLLRMYTRWASQHNFKVETVDYQPGDDAGIKSVTLMIEGKNAYGYLRSERGVHRLVRISPFDSAGRRHTSFASVNVMPELDDSVEVELRPEDIKMVQPNEGMIKGIVKSTVFKGVHYEILVKENDRMWMLHNTKSAEVGSELGMDIYPEDIHIMRKVEN